MQISFKIQVLLFLALSVSADKEGKRDAPTIICTGPLIRANQNTF